MGWRAPDRDELSADNPTALGVEMRLDIVVPAHNEQARIQRTLSAYRQLDDPDIRFLVALDRCTDATADIVRGHARHDRRVEVHEYPKLGKGGVIMETFRRCDGELIGFVDADCSTPPREFLRLAAAARTADGAIASRRHPASVLPARRSTARRLSSLGFAWTVRAVFGLPYADTQCGAKVFRRPVVERVLPVLSSRDFTFDVDLLVAARRLGFTIVEVPTVWIDRDGSHVSALSDGKRMAASSLRLWLHHRVMPVPAGDVDADVIDLTEPDPVDSHAGT